jgi:NhaA family Na+:H+ antiporter
MVQKIKNQLAQFLQHEAASGILIIVAAVFGLLIANSPAANSYFEFLNLNFAFGPNEYALNLTTQKFINYVLMTIFFFIVGLEIKREMTSGHLASLKKALTPILAAFGGIAIPAIIYLVIAGSIYPSGWGVPVATDIALAIGVLTLIGRGVPESLRVFLLGLAVIDDIAAILIIALIYSSGIKINWLIFSAISVLSVVILRKIGIKPIVVYLILGALLWLGLYKTGVHATLAGVIMGLLAPNVPVRTILNKEKLGDESLIEWLEHKIHPVSSYFVVPLFAFANTGVILNLESMQSALNSKIAWGIFFGLVIGKPLGIAIITVLSAKMNIAEFPKGSSKSMIIGTGSAAGIGFTVAIFIAQIAFDSKSLQDIAIIAVIFASVVSGLISVGIFSLIKRRNDLAAV